MNVRKVFLRNLSSKVKGGASEIHRGKFIITNAVMNRVLITTPILKRSICHGVYILDFSGRGNVVLTGNDYYRTNSDGTEYLG